MVGVGTGSTVNHFIDALAHDQGPHRRRRVQQREEHRAAARARHRRCSTATSVERIPVYIDGADEIDRRGYMIKGGGAALTREKIVADLAERFVCIADESKLRGDVLGRFPLPVEVIPMAAAQVARRFAALGGHGRAARRRRHRQRRPHPRRARPEHRPTRWRMEAEINQWPGVVTVGIFARHRASVCLLGTPQGVQTLSF